MIVLRLNESIATIALLTLLSLSAVASIAVNVNASPVKVPTVYITGSGLIELHWKSGKSETYSSDGYASLGGLYSISVMANHGWHIAAFSIDGNPQAILDDHAFTVIGVQAKISVSATFLPNNGVDSVNTGSNVEAYPYPDVGLIFDSVLTNGSAYAYTSEIQPPNAKGKSWDISTTAAFNQSVTVILVLNLAALNGSDTTSLRLLRTEVEVFRADVDLDGVVTGSDVSMVAYANPSVKGVDPRYDPKLDMNNDGVINDIDVNIVNNYIGDTVWQDITVQVVVDTTAGLVYVYGITDHFSIFGVR
jgi:hypothetical protein